MEGFWKASGSKRLNSRCAKGGVKGQTAALVQRVGVKLCIYTHYFISYMIQKERCFLILPLGKQIEHPVLSSLQQKQRYKHVLFFFSFSIDRPSADVSFSRASVFFAFPTTVSHLLRVNWWKRALWHALMEDVAVNKSVNHRMVRSCAKKISFQVHVFNF